MPAHWKWMTLLGVWLLGLAFPLAVAAEAPQSEKDPWAAWRFVLGDWVGEGSGQPGAATSAFSFHPALGGKILVRKTHNDIQATKDHPASTHEDLLVVYPEGSATRAIYFDNEGHVIRYTASFSADGNTLTFLSATEPSSPRFRLTYAKGKDGALRINFEIAPPGKPEEFSTYIGGSAHRKAAHP